MIKSKAFTVTFNYFEPGTLIVPTSPRCVLSGAIGSVMFEVTRCHEPLFAEDGCIVFVAGHSYTGVDTEYLREATKEEIATFTRFA